MTWLNYKHIKKAVAFANVLEYYNIQLREKGDSHLIGKCPLPTHSGDRTNTNTFHVDLIKNAYNCFTHCPGGNIIDFVAEMESCEFREAAQKLHERFLVDTSVPGVYEPTAEMEIKTKEVQKKNKLLKFELKGLKPYHPFLLKEKKLTKETINHFGLGFCSKGLLAGWLAIPVHNELNKIVAYIGRAIDSTQAETDGKYKIPPSFLKSLEVFNLNRVVEEHERIDKYGLIIVESFFSVFWLYQLELKNVVALMGWSISDQQIEKLVKVSNKLTVFLDGDKTGREATEKIVERLNPHAFVRVIHCPNGPKRKPTHFEKDELRELLK